MDPLVVGLKQVRRRLFVRQWLYFTARSLVYSASAACFWLMCTRLFPTLGSPVPVFLGLVVLGVCAAAVLSWVRRPTLVDAALAADARLGLQERLTSSVELARVEAPMVRELHADARAHLDRLKASRDFPVVAPNAARWAYLPLLLFGVAYLLLPEFDLFGFEARKAAARAKVERVQMRVQRLKRAARPLEEAASMAEGGPLAEAAGLVNRVAEQLELGQITEKQALARLKDLREALEERRDKLLESNPMPKLAADARKLDALGDLAKSLAKGQFGRAADKLRELQQKLAQGDLSKEELEAIAQDLEELAQLLGIENAALAEALAEAAKCLRAGKCKAACGALGACELSLEDLASIFAQLDELAKAGLCLGCCCNGLYGRIGAWRPGEAKKFGPGSGGPGRGSGRVNESTGLDVGFEPSMLPGPRTDGPILLSVEQLGAPDEDAEPMIEYIQGAFIEARQAAEQALEQEEIPRGSREFVRQYFGTLEENR